MSPLCFPNYRLRKPETFIPMPKGCLFIPKTTSLPPSPAGIFLPHHIATELSHIANCGYSPLSGIHPLLCQEKKPIFSGCPETLKSHSYLQKNSLYQKVFLQYYLQPFGKAQTLIYRARDPLIHIGQGTVFRTSGYVTLLVIIQGHHSKITILLFFFSC